MSVGTVIYSALQALVGGRVYAGEFPQDAETPTWPAIRFTQISEDVAASLGGVDQDATDVLVQVDVVAEDYDSMRLMRRQVIAAMESVDPPSVLQDGSFDEVDPDLAVHRAVLLFRFQPSSVDGSPW